jgi:hypothetical protein
MSFEQWDIYLPLTVVTNRSWRKLTQEATDWCLPDCLGQAWTSQKRRRKRNTCKQNTRDQRALPSHLGNVTSPRTTSAFVQGPSPSTNLCEADHRVGHSSVITLTDPRKYTTGAASITTGNGQLPTSHHNYNAEEQLEEEPHPFSSLKSAWQKCPPGRLLGPP